MKILSVDIGTTAMKMGVFEKRENDLKLLSQFYREYPINTYNDGLFSDIEQEKWQQAFAAGCKGIWQAAPQGTYGYGQGAKGVRTVCPCERRSGTGGTAS